jgi:hypothetical protein
MGVSVSRGLLLSGILRVQADRVAPPRRRGGAIMSTSRHRKGAENLPEAKRILGVSYGCSPMALLGLLGFLGAWEGLYRGALHRPDVGRLR